MNTELTRAAAEFVAGLAVEAIPARALEAARVGVTDCIGVMIAGSAEEPVEIVASITSAGTSDDSAPAIPSGRSLKTADAALQNGVAIAVLTLGIPIGSSLGVAYGAWAATRFGWRTAFTSLTIPGLLLGLALPLLIREPRRGQFDAHPAIAGVSIGSTVKTFLASPSLRAIVASSAICAFVMYIQLAWTPAYLMRVKGMTLSQMGTFYSPCVGISVCAGSILSGIVFDRLLRKTPRAYGLIPAVSVLLALPFFVAGLLIEDWRIAVPLLGICQLLTVMYQVPAVAATQNFISASQRASATAILMFVLNVVALGLGPLFVGGVSDLARARFGHGSLGIAMLAVVPFFVLAAVLSFASSRVRAEPPQSELSSSGPLGRAR